MCTPTGPYSDTYSTVHFILSDKCAKPKIPFCQVISKQYLFLNLLHGFSASRNEKRQDHDYMAFKFVEIDIRLSCTKKLGGHLQFFIIELQQNSVRVHLHSLCPTYISGLWIPLNAKLKLRLASNQVS